MPEDPPRAFGGLLENPDHFVVEGRWCVESLLASDLEVIRVFRAEGRHESIEESFPGRTDFPCSPPVGSRRSQVSLFTAESRPWLDVPSPLFPTPMSFGDSPWPARR